MPTHIDVAVFGASGYAGGELLRYLAAHPVFRIAHVTADANAGRPLRHVAPHLAPLGDLTLAPSDPSAAPDIEVAFLALPAGTSAEIGHALRRRGVTVVDLSGDWRLRDPAVYRTWYGAEHPYPDKIGDWAYGLPELDRAAVAGAQAVTNPGCYPTAALLAIAPVAAAVGLADGPVVIHAMSGVSGAGRGGDPALSLGDLDGNVRAYGVATHRHTPEIEQQLGLAAGGPVCVSFTPHLVPMPRGLLATCHVVPAASADVHRILCDRYSDEPFVHVLEAGEQPETKRVAGTNHVHIGAVPDDRTGAWIITCAIDNLGKGAAGQAVQNANLACGIDETAGLSGVGVFP